MPGTPALTVSGLTGEFPRGRDRLAPQERGDQQSVAPAVQQAPGAGDRGSGNHGRDHVAGFSTVLWLEVLIVLGFIAFAIYQFRLPAARRTVIDPRAALWVLPWLPGLLILSWLGRYNGSPPTVFGVTLLATNHLPNWWDLATNAAFSLVIYYWAVHSTLPHQRVSAAVEQVETEASVELETALV